MRDDVVQEWISAYRDYAEALREIAEKIAREHRVGNFGNLDSLRQLAEGYDRLLIGAEGSLHQRVLEFAVAADRVADKLEADWLRILEEDGQTASVLSSRETGL